MAGEQAVEPEVVEDEVEEVVQETETPPAPPTRPGTGRGRPGTGRGADPPEAPARTAARRGETITVDADAYATLRQKAALLDQQQQHQQQQQQQQEQERVRKEAPKDANKALQRQAAQFNSTIENLKGKVSAYEGVLKKTTLERAIREGMDRFDQANPRTPVRQSLRAHLSKALATDLAAEWDAEGGEFVAIEPLTNRLAADVIVERLASPEYEGFLAASTQGGAGGRFGGMRPGSGLPQQQQQQQQAGRGRPQQQQAQQTAEGQALGLPGVGVQNENPFARRWAERTNRWYESGGAPARAMSLSEARGFSNVG